MKQITGNKLLVKALKEEGVEYLFGYPLYHQISLQSIVRWTNFSPMGEVQYGGAKDQTG